MSRIILPDDDELLYSVVELPYIRGIDGIDIWIKFASYLKEEDALFLESLKGLDINSLSRNDFDRYQKIINQMNLCELFKKYKNEECTKEEHDYVFSYMENVGLDSFIKTKITDEEINKSSKFINVLSKESLKDYIDFNVDRFNKLSIYEAYVLLSAEKRLYDIEHMEFVNHVLEEQSKRAKALHRSLLKDYGYGIYLHNK